MISRINFVRLYKHNKKFYCLLCDNIINSNTQKHCPPSWIMTVCLCKYDGDLIIYDSNKGRLFDNTKDEIICTLKECYGKRHGCNYACSVCNFTVIKSKYETIH